MNVNYLETKLGCLRLVKTGFKTVETNLPFKVDLIDFDKFKNLSK